MRSVVKGLGLSGHAAKRHRERDVDQVDGSELGVKTLHVIQHRANAGEHTIFGLRADAGVDGKIEEANEFRVRAGVSRPSKRPLQQRLAVAAAPRSARNPKH